MTVPLPIIWMNGPFGIGQTQAAQVLHTRLPGSFLFDPEEMGRALKKLTPRFSGDLQTHPMWIPLMLDALQFAVKQADGPLIVPMPLTDVARHRRLLSGLKDRGMAVHHYTLLAPGEVVQARLRRHDPPVSWEAGEVEQRLKAFSGEAFARHLTAGERSPDAIAEEIAADLGLTLKPAQKEPLRWLKALGSRR